MLQDLSDAGTTRTITFKTLTGSGCSTLRGKFRVVSLTAASHHTGGTSGTYTETDTTPNSYFYIGATCFAECRQLAAGTSFRVICLQQCKQLPTLTGSLFSS